MVYCDGRESFVDGPVRTDSQPQAVQTSQAAPLGGQAWGEASYLKSGGEKGREHPGGAPSTTLTDSGSLM